MLEWKAVITFEMSQDITFGLGAIMVLITISASSAGRAYRRQIRLLHKEMGSGIILSPTKKDKKIIDSRPQDPAYARRLLQQGLDHLLNGMQASDQALAGDTAVWLSHRAKTIWLGRQVGLHQLMEWAQRAPMLLVSLGLLGTFAGLIITLRDIGGFLEPGTPAEVIITDLAGMLPLMATAFWSSLLGLAFSLALILNNQISGSLNAIEDLELELSHFLDSQLVKLQQRTPTEGLSPVRKEMASVVQGLDTFQSKIQATAETFGDRLIHTVNQAMERTIQTRLDELYNQSLLMAEEAREAVERMDKTANSLSGASQDFVTAAAAFRDTDFATTLQESVQDMFKSQGSLKSTTESLCDRMELLRESLTHTQTDWQILARTAEQELKSCHMASRELQDASQAMQQVQQATTEFAQSLTSKLESTGEAVQQNQKATTNFAQSLGLITDKLASTAEAVRQNQQATTGLAQSLTSKLESTGEAVQQNQQATTDFAQSLSLITDKLASTTEAVRQNQQATTDLAQSLGLITDKLASTTEAVRQGQQATTGLAQSLTSKLESTGEAMQQNQQATTDFAQSLSLITDKLASTAEAVRQNQQATTGFAQSLTSKLESTGEAVQQNQQATTGFAQSLGLITDKLASTTEAVRQGQQATTGLAQSLTSKLESTGEAVQQNQKATTDFAQSLSLITDKLASTTEAVRQNQQATTDLAQSLGLITDKLASTTEAVRQNQQATTGLAQSLTSKLESTGEAVQQNQQATTELARSLANRLESMTQVLQEILQGSKYSL